MKDIRQHFESAGLGDIADAVIADTRSEIWITAEPADAWELGQSRIGGTPDLAPGTAWPRHRVTVDDHHASLALPFVAQLDLATVAPWQSVLPRTGHLVLFADQSTVLGEIDGYPYCASACLFSLAGELHRVEAPTTPESFPGRALSFAQGRSFPDANDLGLDGDQWQRYTTAVAELAQPEPRHALLARPEYGSIAIVPPPGYTALLRVGSDSEINWGDAAWITFAIPDAALAAHRFDEVRAFRWIG
ncbi:MAG TPA: DUF1963 domain-containing protein [Kofleriaceae bacterium]|jgi:hypothetical protein